MARTCTICTHKKASAIDKAVARGESFRNIAKQFLGDEKHYGAVYRHTDTHLRLDVQAHIAEQRQANAPNVVEEFTKNLEFTSKLRDAATEWLTDPDDPEKFTIAPRADEIDVVHRVGLFNVKEPLDVIMRRLATGELVDPQPFVKTVDLRDYSLKVIDRCDMVTDKFAKIEGLYTQDKKNPADLAQYIKVLKDWGIDKTPDELRAKAEQIEAANQIPAGMLVEKVIQVEVVQ